MIHRHPPRRAALKQLTIYSMAKPAKVQPHTARRLITAPAQPREHSPDGATSTHPTTQFIDPERMKGWVGLVSWPIADGLPTLSGPPSAIGLAWDRESSSVKDRRSTTVPLSQPVSTSVRRRTSSLEMRTYQRIHSMRRRHHRSNACRFLMSCRVRDKISAQQRMINVEVRWFSVVRVVIYLEDDRGDEDSTES